jgi:hypothetical protein
MAKAPLEKTALRWNTTQHLELQVDLARFQRRARGKRLRDLAELGLLAEQRGFVIDRAGDSPRLKAMDSILISKSSEPRPAHAYEPDVHEDHDPVMQDLLSQFMPKDEGVRFDDTDRQ